MSPSAGDINIVRSHPRKYTVETIEAKKVDVGCLGKIFGSREHAPTNIVGFVLVVLVVAGITSLFCKPSIPAPDFWDKILPVVTLICGFLFGRKSQS